MVKAGVFANFGDVCGNIGNRRRNAQQAKCIAKNISTPSRCPEVLPKTRPNSEQVREQAPASNEQVREQVPASKEQVKEHAPASNKQVREQAPASDEQVGRS